MPIKTHVEGEDYWIGSVDTNIKRQLEFFLATVEALQKNWEPFPYQLEVIEALFAKKKKLLFLEWARRVGKTELLIFIIWAWSRLRPGSQISYFAPYLKQAKSIVWTPRRLQMFGPKEWVRDIYDSELRVEWSNSPDGYATLYGANDSDMSRGIFLKDGILILDEFAFFQEGFLEIIEPIVADYDCPIIITSTPPISETHPLDPGRKSTFFHMAELAKETGFYSNLPTSANPKISKEWLEKQKAKLYKLDLGHVWEREYEGKRVSASAASLFPMLSRPKHVQPHKQVMNDALLHPDEIALWCLIDPGTRAAFAVLFIAYRETTGEVWLLDEIYEKDQGSNSAAQIWTSLRYIQDSYMPDQWRWNNYYDEAALWFANEIRASFPDAQLSPTRKLLHKRENQEPRPGISLFKRMLLENKLTISDKCEYFLWEAENYRMEVGTDNRPRLPRQNDHALDCFFYFINESFYSPDPSAHLSEKASGIFDAYDIRTGKFESHFTKLITLDNYDWFDY